jgi:hypothetical protein
MRSAGVTRHPATQRELIGFQVPNWDKVLKLANEAAIAFAPLRTIGWDVAVTPDEPSLSEGNVTWATPSGEARIGEIYRYLQVLADSVAGVHAEPAPAAPSSSVNAPGEGARHIHASEIQK